MGRIGTHLMLLTVALVVTATLPAGAGTPQRGAEPRSTDSSPAARHHLGALAAFSHLDGPPARLRHSALPSHPSGDARDGGNRRIEAEPGDRTVTVRADCLPGSGAVVLRHTTEDGATRVALRSRGLGEEVRWTGEHLLEIGVDDTIDTRLDLVAVDGDLRTAFDVDDTGKAGVLDLRHGQRRCFASFDETPRRILLGGARDSVALWHPKPQRYVTRGQVDCRPGSQWSVEMSVGFDDHAFGTSSRPYACRRPGFFTFHWTTRSRPGGDTPVELGYEARNLDTGQVRRLSYLATSPVVRGAATRPRLG